MRKILKSILRKTNKFLAGVFRLTVGTFYPKDFPKKVMFIDVPEDFYQSEICTTRPSRPKGDLSISINKFRQKLLPVAFN